VVRVQASKILACVDPVPLEILPQERAQLLPFVGSLGLSGLVVVLLQAVGTSLSFPGGFQLVPAAGSGIILHSAPAPRQAVAAAQLVALKALKRNRFFAPR
jgi:hypothetical protein